MGLKSWQMLRLLDPELISKIKIACVFGSSGNEAIIVTNEDKVFSFGVNESGCLGLGVTQASLRPMKIEALCNKKVKGFAFGSGPFVVALTENGEVYSWGKNDVGQVGNCKSGENVLTPTLVGGELVEKQVVEIACGGSHTLALTAEGQVYFWGLIYGLNASPSPLGQSSGAIFGSRKSRFQQSVSFPPQNPHQNTPKRVNFDTEIKVVAIACGNKTSMALLANGEVYGWSHGDQGQLAQGATDDYQPNPCWISSFKHAVITKVACGYAHTLAISDVGDLFAWGDNTNGQLGTGSISPANKPVCITSGIGRVVDIAAVHHLNLSAALTENSEVYMWGNCRGQSITKPLKTYFTSLNDVFACCATVTPTPIRVDMNPRTTVAESMRKAFNDPKHSDLTMMVDGKPIYLHKAFLKIRCEHLETRFSERWQEGSTNVCKTKDYAYEVYQPFLEYLYTDEVHVPVKDAFELLDLANSYHEDELKRKCVDIIKQGLTVKNAAYVYGKSLVYGVKELEVRCLQFCVNHMSAIIDTKAYNELKEAERLKLIETTVKLGVCRSQHNTV